MITLSIISCSNKSDLKKSPNKIDSIQIELNSSIKLIDSLNSQNDSLKSQSDALKSQNDSLITVINYWFNEKYDANALFNIGINNPKDFIIKSLRAKPEIIPIKGVLGGTMRFGNVEILSHKWIIADFDDGHILGSAIFRYYLNDKKELEFQLIESTIR